MTHQIALLLIEDDDNDAFLIQEMLTRFDGEPSTDVAVTQVERLRAGLAHLDASPVDVLLLDLHLPDSQGIDTLRRVCRHAPKLPIIVLTGLDDRALALQAVQEGAQDYLIKGQVGAGLLARAIRYAIARKEAERALCDSEARFRSFVAQSQDAIVITGEQGLVAEWNEAATRIFGLDAAHTLGRPLWDVLFQISRHEDRKPGALPKLQSALEEALRTGQSPIFGRLLERRIQQPDGRQADLQTMVFPITTDQGCILGSTTRDVTEDKAAERELQRRTAQLEALRQVGLELSGQLNPDDLLRSIVSHAVTLVQGVSGGLYLYHPDLDLLVWSTQIDPELQPLGTSLRRGEGLSGKVWETGRALIIDDYGRWEGRASIREGERWMGMVGVPIYWGERFLGVLNVQGAAQGAFSAPDAEILEMFAASAAAALENARLFEAEREQRALAEALGQATAAVSSTLDLNRVLDQILDQVMRVVPNDLASIFMIDGQEARMVRYRLPEPPALVPRSPTRQLHIPRYPYLMDLVRDGGPVVVPDIRNDPKWVPADQEAWRRAYVAAPIRVRGRIIGFLGLAGRHAGQFGPADGARLQAFADHTAYAIENARLYQEAQRRNRELALLNRVIVASAARQTTPEILETVCRELAIAFETPYAAAALVDDARTKAVVVAEHPAKCEPSHRGKAILTSNDPAFGDLLERHTPWILKGTYQDARLVFPGPPPVAREAGGAATTQGLPGDEATALISPLVVQDRVIGCLTLLAPTGRIFSTAEIELGERVSQQVSAALARARLQEAQHHLSAAVEQVTESIIVVDPAGTILYVNPSFEMLTGSSAAEVTGQPLSHLLNGSTGAPFFRQLWMAMLRGHLWRGRLTISKPGGGCSLGDTTVAPVYDGSGQVVSSVAITRDVSREVQLEEQFYQAQKLDAIGRLAGGIAHDFNNLLTVIQLSLRLLERKLEPDDAVWPHVQQIRESSERATRLTSRLLSFSRQEVVVPRLLNLNDVIRDLAKMLRPVIGEDIEFVSHLAEDLWWIRADPTRMEQVILNLVVNARDAMPQGGTLTISTAAVTLDEDYTAEHVDVVPGEYVMLTVIDTGMGMSAEVKAHLFEPFFTTKERGQGTGLGLATVFGIVKQGGGHISVQSKVGEGAAFQIYVPRADLGSEPAAPELQLAGLHAGVAGGMTIGGETILLVEDEADVRLLAAEILSSHGYRVLTASNGVDAMQILVAQAGRIDLLISDVVMPNANGWELAKQAKARWPAIRVLFVSGYASSSAALEQVRAMGTPFLSKPFDPETLAEKVRSVLAGEA